MNKIKIYLVFLLFYLLSVGCINKSSNSYSRIVYSLDNYEWINYTYSLSEERLLNKSSSIKNTQYEVIISQISKTDSKVVCDIFVDNIVKDTNITFSTEYIFQGYHFLVEIDSKKNELVKVLNFSEFRKTNENNKAMQKIFAYYKNDYRLIEETIKYSLQNYFVSKLFYVNNLEYSLKNTIWSDLEYNLYGENVKGELGISAKKQPKNLLNINFNSNYYLDELSFEYYSHASCNFNLSNNNITKLELSNKFQNNNNIFEIKEKLKLNNFKLKD